MISCSHLYARLLTLPIMVKGIFVILALCSVPTLGAAQHAAPEIPAPRRETGVPVTVSGYLLPSPSGRIAFPPSLLERLAEGGALLAVDTAPSAGRVVVQVRFGFADIASFQRWYTDERTVRLLAEVKGVTISGKYETYLSYRGDRVQ